MTAQLIMRDGLLYLCLVILNSFVFTQSASLGGSDLDISGMVDETFDRSRGRIVLEGFDAHKYINLPWLERVRETEKRITNKEAFDYMTEFGYLQGDFSGLNKDRLDLFIIPALRKFQFFNHLEVTGKLDEATKHLMAEPRCAFPDILPSNPDRRKRYTLGQTKWSATDLPIRIKFTSHSSKMKKAEQEEAMRQAAKAWEKASSIEFAFGNEKFKSTIEIDFIRLDGLWGILGRAWFPRVGRIAFENDENWVPNTIKSEGKLSFQSVAMHELGHALGISHSNKVNSIMAAQYSREVQDLKEDDIKAIQSLYGKPPRKRVTEASKVTKSDKKNKNKNRNDEETTRRNKTTTTTTSVGLRKRRPVATTTAEPRNRRPVATTTAEPRKRRPVATTTAEPRKRKTTTTAEPRKRKTTTTAKPRKRKTTTTTTAEPKSRRAKNDKNKKKNEEDRNNKKNDSKNNKNNTNNKKSQNKNKSNKKSANSRSGDFSSLFDF